MQLSRKLLGVMRCFFRSMAPVEVNTSDWTSSLLRGAVSSWGTNNHRWVPCGLPWMVSSGHTSLPACCTCHSPFNFSPVLLPPQHYTCVSTSTSQVLPPFSFWWISSCFQVLLPVLWNSSALPQLPSSPCFCDLMTMYVQKDLFYSTRTEAPPWFAWLRLLCSSLVL